MCLIKYIILPMECASQNIKPESDQVSLYKNQCKGNKEKNISNESMKMQSAKYRL